MIKRIYKFAPIGSDVIILEKLFDEGSCSPFNAAMMDICMMVETDGRHRTYVEYVKILEISGFESLWRKTWNNWEEGEMKCMRQMVYQ